MTAAHCPGCTGHRVLSVTGPLVTAQFGQPCPGVQDGRAELVAALRRARDTIREWYDLQPSHRRVAQAETEAWALYQHSPEMRQINAALAFAEKP